MSHPLAPEILAVIEEGRDLTLATLREDGWPQATTVSYVNDGPRIFFGCGADSQKCRNLTRDDRLSVTINLPYGEEWSRIRGLSLGGRGRRLKDPADMAHAGRLFVQAYPQLGAGMTGSAEDLALFEIEPEVISLLDYRKGFGWCELVKASELGW